jgi:hypothetical protein
MAATVVSITIPEADLTRVVKAICNHTGMEPVTGANAKQGLIEEVRRWVVQEERSQAAFTAPNLT